MWNTNSILSDQQLLDFNLQGLIPGPDEEATAFLERAQQCQKLRDTIITELHAHLPFVEEEMGSSTLLDRAREDTRKLYGIAPSWIPLFFSNYQLSPWHGGCAWIFQLQPDSPRMAFFQLRRVFAHTDVYLGLYHRDELIAHELSHVGRMAYEEPQFEEILAYRTSHSRFRRWVGPLLQSSREALVLMGLLLICLVMDGFAVASVKPHAIASAMWWKLLPGTYLTYLIARLGWRYRCFSLCLQKLRGIIHDERKADALIYRLTDREIHQFGHWSPEEILGYAKTQSERSLRWRLIRLAFFLET